ncbi:salicylate 1-monooxygenase [Penicillium alfredii]|uniref:Salicylate 1-monooxygenase n=1 Tax=Penicillium alfredii TaxID=1506179 RepID=A0A9W9ELU2_9EURO|nr:salicylate 1-monooxygenase [Penicillium alfredii]KAJ5084056.1 salicylate 1-monooxygenase [Penicillium alfredii]
MSTSKPLEVTIIGGGVIGVQMAIGLLNRPNIPAILYGQGTARGRQGSGMAFTSNAMENMRQLNPDILKALDKAANPPRAAVYMTNQHPDFFQRRTHEGELPYDFAIRNKAGCDVLRPLPRDQFTAELDKLIPADKFSMRLEKIEAREDGKRVLTFQNGTTAEIDAVLACDRIRSPTRRMFLDKTDPAAIPHDTRQREYRNHISWEKVLEILGDAANNLIINVGPGGYVITYPFTNPEGKFLGIGAVMQDAEEWKKLNLKDTTDREGVVKYFSGWEPGVQKLIAALPEAVDFWIIFDSTRHPLKLYAFGPVCVAGDAAHVSPPFLGVGACLGIEDVLTLATVFVE